MPISGQVAIIGVGKTKFGENFDQRFSDMVVDAAYLAYADAGIRAWTVWVPAGIAMTAIVVRVSQKSVWFAKLAGPYTPSRIVPPRR